MAALSSDRTPGMPATGRKPALLSVDATTYDAEAFASIALRRISKPAKRAISEKATFVWRRHRAFG